MKRTTATLALVAALGGVGTSHAADAPSFKLVRSDEDYAYLGDMAVRQGLDPLRYIPLSSTAYLSLGGEARLRVDAIDAPRFGVGGAQPDTYGLGRLLFSADLHLNSAVRVYGELGLHGDFGKIEPPSATDRDGLDAQVLFVDLAPDPHLRLRLGRQELSFNPVQRFISVREGPNIRQSFDGARLTHVGPGLKVDAFLVRPVVVERGAFNDGRNPDQRFWGVYAAKTLNKTTGLDVYVLGLDRDRVRFGAVVGDERRRGVGAHLSGQVGAVDYDAEGMIQGGHFAGLDIRAWGASAGGGYTLDAPWLPRLGVRYDAGSGDRDPTDGKLQTFNPLFPKGAYFNEASLVSWSNLSAWRISLGAAPSKAVTFEISHTDRRRRSGQDAVYLQPMTVLAGSTASEARNVGDMWQGDASWQINRNLRLQLQAVHADAGAAVQAAGGHDVDFAMAIVQIRF